MPSDERETAKRWSMVLYHFERALSPMADNAPLILDDTPWQGRIAEMFANDLGADVAEPDRLPCTLWAKLASRWFFTGKNSNNWKAILPRLRDSAAASRALRAEFMVVCGKVTITKPHDGVKKMPLGPWLVWTWDQVVAGYGLGPAPTIPPPGLPGSEPQEAPRMVAFASKAAKQAAAVLTEEELRQIEPTGRTGLTARDIHRAIVAKNREGGTT